MKLGELLDPRCVIVPLKARSVRDATRQLAKTLVTSGAVADEARLAEILKTEWPEDIVTVEGRLFLPHFRTAAARRLAVAIGVAPEPLSLGGETTRSARVVVLILAPVADVSAYLRTMSAVAAALDDDDLMARVLAATTPAELLGTEALVGATVPANVMVRDVMNTAVPAFPAETPLREAAQTMLRLGLGAVPVTGAGGVVLGLLTHDHLMRFLLPLTVQELSTGQTRAARRKRVSGPHDRLPDDPGAVPVKDVMDRSVLCLAEDQTVADVAALMLSKDIDTFPVTREGALVGFLTRGDIVRKLLGT